MTAAISPSRISLDNFLYYLSYLDPRLLRKIFAVFWSDLPQDIELDSVQAGTFLQNRDVVHLPTNQLAQSQMAVPNVTIPPCLLNQPGQETALRRLLYRNSNLDDMGFKAMQRICQKDPDFLKRAIFAAQTKNQPLCQLVCQCLKTEALKINYRPVKIDVQDVDGGIWIVCEYAGEAILPDGTRSPFNATCRYSVLNPNRVYRDIYFPRVEK